MFLKRTLIGQFKRPRGPLGRLAGWSMARRKSNRRRNEWTIELMELEARASILEIGYGPGYALAEILRRHHRGPLVGLDHSYSMRDAAAARNRAAIEAGRLALLVGPVEGLEEGKEPSLAGPFDRIYAVNVAMFWDDPAAAIRGLAGRLAPGGRIFLTFQPRTGEKTDAAALVFAERIEGAMLAGGLAGTRIERLNELSPMAVCVIGFGKGATQ